MTGAQTSDRGGRTTMDGRWLQAARVLWFTVIIASIVLVALGVPRSIDDLDAVCEAPSECSVLHVTPEGARALDDLGLSLLAYSVSQVVALVVILLGYVVIGLVIFWRRSDDWMAILVSLALVGTAVFWFDSPVDALTEVGSGWRLAAEILGALAAIDMLLLLFLFPNGRFVPRWAPALVLVGSAVVVAAEITDTRATNLILIPLALTIFGSGLLSQVYRYRNMSTPVQRQQTKWVIAGFATWVLSLIVYMVVYFVAFPIENPDPGRTYFNLFALPLVLVIVLFLPLSFAVAILRYRLWDIDNFINRALVYGALTATLVGTYVGAVIGLQAAFRAVTDQGSALAIVISTLAIAALFQPLRRRIQDFIDRRFYRRRYDAARTLAAFSERMRDEVDLDRLAGELVTVVEDTMQPAHVSLWLRGTGTQNVIARKASLEYKEWLETVPETIRNDSVWKMTAYRLALFLADLGWHDVTALARDRRTIALSDQLYRALGSISANLAEGYSRGTGRDRARFYEYALGSARESRDWYYNVIEMAMTTRLKTLWSSLVGRDSREDQALPDRAGARPASVAVEAVEFAPNDPIFAYLQTGAAVNVDELSLDSPAVKALKEAGVKVAVPLVSQGEVMGLLNLGPRLSEQEYSTDDRRLLHDLATQAAPTVQVAQLVRQQEADARHRQRMEQELEVARIIQQTLLPKEVPQLPGWEMAAFYRPAREVGGDFYDFLELPDGRIGILVADVTDKGVPAALVMATTRAILRAAAERLASPGDVLERANDLLHPDIPPRMFVTCLYTVLDPETGRMQYANAGHELPYRRTAAGFDELRATGMPLGLMPGMTYEEKEVEVLPGESILLYSDGLVEAHNPQREMFGFPRLRELVGRHPGGAPLIDHLLGELAGFTGAGWEQEDDVTMVTLHRASTSAPETSGGTDASSEDTPAPATADRSWRTLDEFTLPSEPGNERTAMERVSQAVQTLGLPDDRLERLKTAVAEATMNAMEHGNEYREELPVSIRVLASKTALSVHVTDHGGGQPVPETDAPDLEAKLSGAQTPRGWGLFLIKNMVDELRTTSDEVHHTIELTLHLEENKKQGGNQ